MGAFELQSSPRLKAALRAAATLSSEGVATEGAIARMRSALADDRLIGIMAAQNAVAGGSADLRYLAEAEGALSDPDEDCRWQAAILAGLFIPHEPERIWRIIEEFGTSLDPEVQSMVATILLEHLLARGAGGYSGRAEELARRSSAFRNTLSLCWAF